MTGAPAREGPLRDGPRNALRFLRDPLPLLSETAARGDLADFRVGAKRFFVVNDLDLIDDVLSPRHAALRRQGGYEEGRFAGGSIFTAEGGEHAERRPVLERVFDRAAIEEYADWIGREADSHAAAWQPEATVVLMDEMSRLTLKVMTKAEFGEAVDDDADEAVRAAFRGSREAFHRVRMPHAKLLWALPLPVGRRYLDARRRLDSAFDRALAERRSHLRTDLLSRLLSAQRDDAGRLTDDHVRAEAWSYLAQGAQALALTWAWFLLAGHADVEAELLAEVDRLSGPPTGNDLPRLSLTDAVVSEALRLYPPVWAIARAAREPYPLGDRVVPKGSVILVSPYVTHRDERYWARPAAFDPGRWLADPPPHDPRAFLAYGAGQRRCLGRDLVHLQCILILAATARRWRLRPLAEPVIETFPFLQPKGGLPVRLERRDA